MRTFMVDGRIQGMKIEAWYYFRRKQQQSRTYDGERSVMLPSTKWGKCGERRLPRINIARGMTSFYREATTPCNHSPDTFSVVFVSDDALTRFDHCY
jgi:hypothetical protein